MSLLEDAAANDKLITMEANTAVQFLNDLVDATRHKTLRTLRGQKNSASIEDGYLNSLKKFYEENYPNFCDVAIFCSDGKSVKASKLLLSLKSEFFNLAFKKDPKKEMITLDFESKEVEFAVKNSYFVDFPSDPEDLKICEIKEVIKMADFLQMGQLLYQASKLMAKISKDVQNQDFLTECLEICQFINVPIVEQICADFIKKDIFKHFEDGTLKTLPKSILKRCFSRPYMAFEDHSWKMQDNFSRSRKALDLLLKVLEQRNDTIEEFIDFCFDKNRLYYMMTMDQTLSKC